MSPLIHSEESEDVRINALGFGQALAGRSFKKRDGPSKL
jgi:hypothetical protein